ncbi:DUF2382 domain-containing protein [Pantoea sp. LMR881]|uniref:DUF2382 domain-containing protein n=1 Tax=Pantoea sp. LMR881 TaxID=3014336 RepID=UPI0022AF0696|nr:DUF2382 domain-containing protein [Pantoea sp. LMR881]MCZ4058543.1 DUF2382 domain-containing protein [Pantoea sp. LMR881]
MAKENVSVTREEVVDSRIKVTRSTSEHEQTVNALLKHEKVDITRIPKGERVDVMPDIREEDGVLIVPVVEEEIEIVRKLVLKEELHIRKTRQEIPFEEVVTLRKQQISVSKDDNDT